jgi:hypothetical protein
MKNERSVKIMTVWVREREREREQWQDKPARLACKMYRIKKKTSDIYDRLNDNYSIYNAKIDTTW